MLSPDIIARYRAARAEGRLPAHLGTYLRTDWTPAYPLEWEDARKGYAQADIVVDGFDVMVQAEYDDDPMDDDIDGRFCSSNVAGAIPRRRFGDKPDRGEYTHWLPPESEASMYREYRKAGYGKHAADCAARAFIRDAYKRACSEDPVLCLRVDVEYHGVKLATEYLGVGKVHGGYREVYGYLTDVAQDAIASAVKEARKEAERIGEDFAGFSAA